MKASWHESCFGVKPFVGVIGFPTSFIGKHFFVQQDGGEGTAFAVSSDAAALLMFSLDDGAACGYAVDTILSELCLFRSNRPWGARPAGGGIA